VIEDFKVEPIIEAILNHAVTGEVGDGKIFILPVDEDNSNSNKRTRRSRCILRGSKNGSSTKFSRHDVDDDWCNFGIFYARRICDGR
ncbi:P-II family nitrogen regulator, partial [Leptospira santarosai]|nr:P-II family nitrogen regulator [Leptospira santarosai]